MRLDLSAIGQVVNARQVVGKGTCRSVTIDTRRLSPGALFVALQGQHFDGHDFVTEAIDKGAAALMVNRRCSVDAPQIVVADTLQALGRLAAGWRKNQRASVIAVTGTNGKTTVKEMLSAIFSVRHKPLVTQGNLNNQIGVPLSLLRLTPANDVAVIEMGANHPGEIEYLSMLACPDVALITNAGIAHLQGFGSVEQVARAKGELFSGLALNGTAVINIDDPLSHVWREMIGRQKILTFGMNVSADVSCPGQEIKQESGPDGFRFQLRIVSPVGEIVASMGLPGEHNISNALAASAAAIAAGATADEIGRGLSVLEPIAGRLQLTVSDHGIRIIDDTYNANPSSMQVALDVLAAMAGEKILVLGDMAELGLDAAHYHRQVAGYASAAGITRLYATGELTRFTIDNFNGTKQHFDDQKGLVDSLRADLSTSAKEPVTVLIKGSRCMHMEHVVAALTAPEDGGEGHGMMGPGAARLSKADSCGARGPGTKERLNIL